MSGAVPEVPGPVAGAAATPLSGGGVEAVTPARRTRLARRHPVVWFLLRRVAIAVPTLLVISMLIFAACELLPGDVAEAILGRTASPSALADVRGRLHLDQPATERYVNWLGGLVHGDLGTSATGVLEGRKAGSVRTMIAPRLVNSLILAGITLLILVPLAVIAGVVAALHAGGFIDRVLSLGSVGLIAIPEFVTALVLILVFAVKFSWFPAVSFVPVGSSVLDSPNILVLPMLTLLAASFAQMMRMIRAGVLDVATAPYVEMAMLSGLRRKTILVRFVLRNALAPSVQVLALTMQWLIGGIIVTEYVFGYQGIGNALVDAVSTRDIPYVEGTAMVIAVAYVARNINADLVVILLVAKLRTAQLEANR